MIGVLGKFFQIALVMTIAMFGINFAIDGFGYELTGDPMFSGQPILEQRIDLNTSTGEATVTEITQTGAAASVPSTQSPKWDDIYEQMLNMGGSYQRLLGKFFNDIDTTSSTDAAQQLGELVRTILLLFQIAGLAYIPFALWSAAVGGGSP